MRWIRRGRRPVHGGQRKTVAVEPLESRALFSVASPAVPLSPGSAAGPTAALTTLTPTFTWSAAAGVNGYELQVADRTDGVTALSVTVGPSTTQYTAKAGTLLPGRFFVWTVRDVVGTTPGAAHGRRYFGTPVPPAPVAAGPSGVLTTVRPTLTWSAVANVNGYVLHLYDRDTGTVVTHTVSATTTTYTFAAGALEPGAVFAWNVRAVIGTTTARAVSNTLHFHLPGLPAPVPVGPGTAASPGPVLTTATPTFTFEPVTAVAGFSGYLFELSDRTTNTTVEVVVSPSTTSYTLPAGQLHAGHQYAWNLRLQDGTTYIGFAVSPSRYFVGPA